MAADCASAGIFLRPLPAFRGARKEGSHMKVIFEEYSGIIITAVAIVALIAIATFLLQSDGVVSKAFTDMINGLLAKTNLS